MLIFPAIDLKDGKVVRLFKGSFDTVHRVADDPITVAETFLRSGAKYIHMVDLDGARSGQRSNSELVKAVVQTGLNVELGGGIRNMHDLESAFELGIWRAVIGSAAVSDPDFVKAAVKAFGPKRIAVGIDVLDHQVRTLGWESDSGLDYLDFACSMEAIGVKNIIFTDIETDGMLTGPSYQKLSALQKRVSCSITSSGGISCNEDIIGLRDRNIAAAIIGKAWYAGKIDLAQAIADAGIQE